MIMNYMKSFFIEKMEESLLKSSSTNCTVASCWLTKCSL